MSFRVLLRLVIGFLLVLGSFCKNHLLEDIREFQDLKYIYGPHTFQYAKSSVLANHACSYMCPQLVALPKSVEQVSKIVQICNVYNISLSIRGGGHGYTCQVSIFTDLSIYLSTELIYMKHYSQLTYLY